MNPRSANLYDVGYEWSHTVKKSVHFTVKYLASGCQFFNRYFYGRLPIEQNIFRNQDMVGLC